MDCNCIETDSSDCPASIAAFAQSIAAALSSISSFENKLPLLSAVGRSRMVVNTPIATTITRPMSIYGRGKPPDSEARTWSGISYDDPSIVEPP